MFFLYLGCKNAWRSIGRSSIAIISMALATAFLTYSLTLGRGYSAELYAGFRAFSGGEIAVYATRFDGSANYQTGRLQYHKLQGSPQTDIGVFYPEYLSRGFLTTAEEVSDGFAAVTMKSLADFSGVEAVYPRYQIPVLRHSDIPGRATLYDEVFLRGRDYALDALQYTPLPQYISQGRWFTPEDEGSLVCVLSRYNSIAEIGVAALQPGDTIRISLPTIVQSGGGSINFDFINMHEVSLTVIGFAEVPTRDLHWINHLMLPMVETLYWQFDDIHIPLGTWLHLWQQAGGEIYEPQQLNIITKEVSFLEDMVAALNRAFPQYTMVSVARQIERAKFTPGLETPALEAPESVYFLREAMQPLGGSDDMRMALGIGIFSTAALIIAANLLIMAGERKTEIAILKSVGTLRREIMQMIIGEAVLIAALGTGIGFFFVRLQALLSELTITSGLFLIVGIATDLLIVLGAATLVSVLFALLPALKMAGLSVMEVMRK